jgi:16S rRNA (uracil1498-N3)-methyltransferase
MRLFLLDESFHGQNPYEISGSDAHYLADVLRLPIGQSIMARDMSSQLWSLKLKEIRKGVCIVETRKAEQASKGTDALPEYQDLLPITLFQCLTRPKKLEQIVRQATEIGVSRIVLVRSRYSCTEKIRPERLDAQIKEAIQQSGSLVPTAIEGPVDIKDIKPEPCGTALFFHQTSLPGQHSLQEATCNLKDPVSLLIGPEGGLDDSECSILRSHSFEPVLLDTNILRAETAAVYGIAVVQSALQNRSRKGNNCC